jgi:hypothetical protein
MARERRVNAIGYFPQTCGVSTRLHITVPRQGKEGQRRACRLAARKNGMRQTVPNLLAMFVDRIFLEHETE